MSRSRSLSRFAVGLLVTLPAVVAPSGPAAAAVYYVRQTVGDDARDGRSPETAWAHVAKLGAVMQAGDTAYVGPGLYREEIDVMNDGRSDARLVFVADTTGQHTGDPPGVVMLTGADPVDGTVFGPHTAPGVYMARLPERAWGAVEMDGAQFRYGGTRETREHAAEHMPEVDVVAKLPSTYYWDEASDTLYLHTSDGRPPSSHEMELIHRGNGVAMTGKHYVTVMGFTFRSMQDSGVNFFKGSGHGIALGNTAYGCRQGIRVYAAVDILVSGNTLFRNENSGAYFAAGSTSGVALGNVSYENVKGLRWSSQSSGALVVDNLLFDNRERGLALENADGALVRGNVLVDNAESQLLVWESGYSAEANCFATGRGSQRVADFFPFRAGDLYDTLAAYQAGRRQDLHSSEGGCRPLPGKVDVRRLHAQTTAYAARARALLRGETPPARDAGGRGWLGRLLGR